MTSEATAEGTLGAGAGGARKGAASSASELARLSAFLVFNVAAFLLIIRYLPKGQMGWYALVNVVVNLAYIVADLQMEKVAVRRLAQQEDPQQVVNSAVGVRLVGSVTATAVTQLIFLGIGLARGVVRADIQLAALLASSQFFGETSFVVGSYFQARLRAYIDVAPRILYVVLRFGLTLVLLQLGVPWWALFLAWVGAYLVAGTVAVVLYQAKSGFRLRPSVAGTRPLVQEAMTLGVAGLLGLATVQFGTLYLGVTAAPRQVAIFNAAILPIQYLSLFGSVIAIVAFPLISLAWADRDVERFGRVDATARTAIVALFLPISLFLFAAPLTDAMEALFGAGYGAAAVPLQLMSVALILASLMVWAGFAFLAIGQPRLILTVNALCLAIGVACCPIVVPRFGLPGLGAIGIGATAIGATTAALLLSRYAPSSFDLRGTLRLAVAGAGLWLALTAVGAVNDNFLVLGLVTAVVYPALVLGLKVFPASVLDDLRAASEATAAAEAATAPVGVPIPAAELLGDEPTALAADDLLEDIEARVVTRVRRDRDRRRAGTAPSREDRDLPVALAVGTGLVMLGVVAVLLGPLATAVLAWLLVAAASAEFLSGAGAAGHHHPATLLGVVAAAGLCVGVYFAGLAAIPVVLALTVVLGLVWCLWAAPAEGATDGLGTTLVGVLWIGLLGSFATLLLAEGRQSGAAGPGRHTNPGLGVVAAAVAVAVAYKVGTALTERLWTPASRSAGSGGRSEARPDGTARIGGVAPLGGVALAAVASAVVVGVGGLSPIGDEPGRVVLFTVVCALAAPLGPWCREVVAGGLGVGTEGALLPGGGVVPRVDALLTVLPAAWFVTVLVGLWR